MVYNKWPGAIQPNPYARRQVPRVANPYLYRRQATPPTFQQPGMARPMPIQGINRAGAKATLAPYGSPIAKAYPNYQPPTQAKAVPRYKTPTRAKASPRFKSPTMAKKRLGW